MKKFLSVATVVLMILAITACTTVLPGMATSNPIGSKVGEASYSMILGIPLFSHRTLVFRQLLRTVELQKFRRSTQRFTQFLDSTARSQR